MNEKQELYYWLKTKGICVRCSTNKANKGFVTCIDCRSKELDRYYTKMQNEEFRKNKNKLNKIKLKKLREYRKINNLCQNCGVKLENSKYANCARCRARRTAKQRERRLDKGSICRADRERFGLCTTCGKEKHIEGKKLCPRCYENACKNIAIGRNNINREKHIWRGVR